MRIMLDCWLPQQPEWVWQRVQKSATLDFVAAPLITFKPGAGCFPQVWCAGEHRASMWLFGLLPLGWQTIGIEYPEGSDGMVLRDNGHGLMARTWDHWIFVTEENGGTRYVDRVDVRAGLLTPLIGVLARIFYAHRQRRWQVLASRDS